MSCNSLRACVSGFSVYGFKLERGMKVMRVVCALISSLAATAVLAHAHLQKSVPANGAVVNAAPTSVVLTFSEPAKLTACWAEPAL